MVEFGHAKELLKIDNGLFRSMVDATGTSCHYPSMSFIDYLDLGPKSAAYLKKIARGELDLVKDLEESADHQEEERERLNKKV